MKTTIVIPARMGSSRFPGKPLEKIAGKIMLERVWQIAGSVQGVSRVLIATDSEEISLRGKAFGAEVVLTSPECPTGTDRVFEAVTSSGAGDLRGDDLVVSFQGDAVLTPPEVLGALIRAMGEEDGGEIGTPAYELLGRAREQFIERKQAGSSSGTLVVFDKNHRALYFSKTLIPCARDGVYDYLFQHIGVYAYRFSALRKFVELPQGRLEGLEKLEQLRALENGMSIRVVPVQLQGRTLASVDNPEDIKLVEAIISREGELV